MRSSNAANFEMCDYENDMKAIRRKVLYRGVSDLGEFNLNSLRAGIRLQLKDVGLDNISEDLILRMEKKQREIIRSRKNVYEPTKKLNDMKISLTYFEWYMKTTRSKRGYYDSYKNPQNRKEIASYQVLITLKCKLNQYWINFVEVKDLAPQQEGAKLRKRWLYAGTNYRRIIEPLDIAEYYKTGNTNYLENRPKHYQLLEKWLDEDNNDSNRGIDKRNKAASLTEDSCFGAHLEEVLILLKGSSKNLADNLHKLVGFEAYMMRAIDNFLVSPNIFLEGSCFMKWWNEYKAYRGSSYVSELAVFMNRETYKSYQ